MANGLPAMDCDISNVVLITASFWSPLAILIIYRVGLAWSILLYGCVTGALADSKYYINFYKVLFNMLDIFRPSTQSSGILGVSGSEAVWWILGRASRSVGVEKIDVLGHPVRTKRPSVWNVYRHPCYTFRELNYSGEEQRDSNRLVLFHPKWSEALEQPRNDVSIERQTPDTSVQR